MSRYRVIVWALMALLLVTTGCTKQGNSPVAAPPYSLETVKEALVSADDLGPDADEFWEDPKLVSHVMHIPPSALPTCPYVQRSHTVSDIPAYFQPVGGEPTGKRIVHAKDFHNTSIPTITEGALVFASPSLAKTAMDAAIAEHAKCPAEFSLNGGPPPILGDYKTTSRSFEMHGWKGYAQHLVHTFPPEQDDSMYDDLTTVVALKANAIVFIGYHRTMDIGEPAVSPDELHKVLKTSLARLG